MNLVIEMKLPREMRTYCPYCHKHTNHSLDKVKKRKASEQKWGQRRFRRVTAGYGGFPRPKPEGREKPTRRVPLVKRCKECKKAHQSPAKRAKKFEFKE
jgi:large subunit ribosomal protein L44e